MPATQIAAGRAFTYLDCLGRGIRARNGFMYPTALARGAGDTLYVANWGDEFIPSNRITKCTLNHEWIADIGSPGTGEGEFICPGGLALDSEENVYVTDQSVHKIVIADKEGTFLGKWGKVGPGEGELNRPSGMAFDKDDNLYVSDSLNHRVQKFTREGKFLAMWGEEGLAEDQFNIPWGITIDRQGDVYVADWGNNRVQKFSAEGRYLATFDRSGTGNGELNHPSDVAVDKDGDVYVADWGNNRVQVYGPDGRYLVTIIGDAMELSPWGKMTLEANPDYLKARARADLEPEWRLHRPVAVTVGDDYRIVIAETMINRLQVYLKDVEYEDSQFNL